MDLVDSALGENKAHKTRCIHCDMEIVEYYDDHYSGQRGRCPSCKIDFPLD